MRLTALILLVTGLLAGCAANNVGSDYALDANAGAGVATGTITYVGGYAAYRLHVVNEQSGQAYRIEHGSSQTLNPVLAFKGEEVHPDLQVRGSPFAVELPAGAYVIRSWQVSQGAANVWSTAPTGLKFDVQAGKAIYLGNFHFKETSRFVRAITGATVSLNDESARDLPAIAKLSSSLKSAPVSQALKPGTRLESIGGQSGGRINYTVFVPVMR